MYGELVPIGGGDPIPLLKPALSIGRRESCDIVLRFGNVSGVHCELNLDHGWWFIKDCNSQNGTRVNGLRVSKKRLDPGDRLTISRHDYEVRYSPTENGGDDARPPEDDVFSDIMGRSLMESAGLDRKKKQEQEGRIGARRKPGSSANRPADSSPADPPVAEKSNDDHNSDSLLGQDDDTGFGESDLGESDLGGGDFDGGDFDGGGFDGAS